MKNAVFPTNTTDDQWKVIEPMLPTAARTGRPRTPLRLVVDAILYVVKSGCQWNMLPKSFPPYKTVFHIFRAWARSGVLGDVQNRLRAYAREFDGRRSRPTAGIIDSQTVRSAGLAVESGYDAGKKTKGRKRFIMVDTLGHLIAVMVTPADVQEREGGIELLKRALPCHAWLRKIWVDGGYSGEDFANQVRDMRPKLDVEVVKRSDKAEGFEVLPRRWVVERTFGWLMQCRRLVRDYERTVESAVGWIHVAMIRIMLRRMA
jgi:putative transposase